MFEFDKIETPEIENPVIKEKIKPTLPLDTQLTPMNSIMKLITGSKWLVEYYRQMLTADMQPTPLDLEREAINQQYMKIVDLELRVENALSPQQDDKTKEFTMTGTANVFPGMVPIKGDMFLANTGDGIFTLFTVTRTMRLTNAMSSLHEIEYKAVSTLEQLHLENLAEKTSKEVVFNKDFLAIGKNPLLNAVEETTYQKSLEILDEVTRYYFDTFFDTVHDCFTIPNLDNHSAMDPFLNDFIIKIIPKRDYPQYNRIIQYNRHSIIPDDYKTVLDYLLHDDVNVAICSYPERLYLRSFLTHRFHVHSKGIETASVDYAVSVSPTDTEQPEILSWVTEPVGKFQLVQSNLIAPEDFTEQVYSGSSVINHSTVGNRYILSDAFYDFDFVNMSVIEKMIYNAIRKDPIHPNSVIKTIDYLMNQANLVDQHYLLPICYRLLEKSLVEIN